MSSTAGDEGQCGRFRAKEGRTRTLLLAAIFPSVFVEHCEHYVYPLETMHMCVIYTYSILGYLLLNMYTL